jgi:excisionase family DNA binding protein
MKNETTLLHHFLPKRGLSRIEAASYIGVGTSKFDAMVRDGRMPAPKRIDGRVIWDLRRLDEAFESLPGGNADHNPWDEAAA